MPKRQLFAFSIFYLRDLELGYPSRHQKRYHLNNKRLVPDTVLKLQMNPPDKFRIQNAKFNQRLRRLKKKNIKNSHHKDARAVKSTSSICISQ